MGTDGFYEIGKYKFDFRGTLMTGFLYIPHFTRKPSHINNVNLLPHLADALTFEWERKRAMISRKME